ncbi:MAG: 3-ketoacyl-ACP reductase [Tannerella sp.]|jgi:NAD(P)-dependent dehydrogenase (short-subunit alcohol dehydrogenase family)|nr:3-ketoacyl-ACP reductase [Tannerella sp.]
MYSQMKKTAIITGGARGIGFAIAQQLAADGFNIAIFGRKDESAVEGQLSKLNALGSDTMYYCGNIAVVDDCYQFVSKVIDKYQHIDLLVNNSGVAPKVRTDMLETTEESMDYVFGINVKGTFFMTQAVARHMLEQNAGIIINISSVSAYASSVNRPEYCMSKSAISMITTLFADRLAPHGIRVYEIRPGVIRTDMTSAVTEKYDRMIADGIFPIARWGTPEDVAKAVSAFASGAFPYSTGEIINVDGGFHLRRL